MLTPTRRQEPPDPQISLAYRIEFGSKFLKMGTDEELSQDSTFSGSNHGNLRRSCHNMHRHQSLIFFHLIISQMHTT